MNGISGVRERLGEGRKKKNPLGSILEVINVTILLALRNLLSRC